MEANGLEKVISGIKDNINSIKAELQALSQRAGKDNSSVKRISLSNANLGK